MLCIVNYSLNKVEKLKCGREQKNSETKIVGTPLDKHCDTLRLDFEKRLKVAKPFTRRKVISVINSIDDVLGWRAPITITAELIFNEVYLRRLHCN